MIKDKIQYIRKFYKTLWGKPVESCPDYQINAVYNSIIQRKNKENNITMPPIIIYTDGACRGNHTHSENIGAYAYKLIFKDKVKTCAKVFVNTTNNLMELYAVVNALRALNPVAVNYEIQIHSDSMYVVKGATEWLPGWLKTNFKNIKNEKEWRILNELIHKYNIKFIHVKGHSGDPDNEEVDRLCNEAMDRFLDNKLKDIDDVIDWYGSIQGGNID